MSLPTPIKDLPKSGHNVFIRARVDYKSNLKICKTGNEQLILRFLDDTDIISAVAYGEEAKKFYETIQVNKVYDLFNFKINYAKKEYTGLENDYELSLDKSTRIVECKPKTVDVPAMQYNFVTIAEILKLPEGTAVECIAVCTTKTELMPRGNHHKRNLILKDDSNASIELTLWNDKARNFDKLPPFVIVVRNATVKVYNNSKYLNMGNVDTSFEINPSLPETEKLKKCFDFESFPPTELYESEGVIYCINCRKEVVKDCLGVYNCECKTKSIEDRHMLKLIETVKKYDCIYNSASPQYKNVQYKNDVWSKISQEVGVSVEEAKQKWKRVQDSYRKSKQRENLPSGSGTRRKPYKYSESLRFLDDVPKTSLNKRNNSKDSAYSEDFTEKASGIIDPPLTEEPKKLDVVHEKTPIPTKTTNSTSQLFETLSTKINNSCLTPQQINDIENTIFNVVYSKVEEYTKK